MALKQLQLESLEWNEPSDQQLAEMSEFQLRGALDELDDMEAEIDAIRQELNEAQENIRVRMKEIHAYMTNRKAYIGMERD